MDWNIAMIVISLVLALAGIAVSLYNQRKARLEREEYRRRVWEGRAEQARQKSAAREDRTEHKFSNTRFSQSPPARNPEPGPTYDPLNPLNPISPISPFNPAYQADPAPASDSCRASDSGGGWSGSDSGSSSCDSSSSSSFD